MVGRLRVSRRLVTLEPGLMHAQRVEDELAEDLVKRPARRLLGQYPSDHEAGVGVLEALTGSERRRSVSSRMIHQFDRAPNAARVLTQASEKCLFAEIVRHARRMREQLAQRRPREGIENPPTFKKLGSELLGEVLIQRQTPLPGEPDDHRGRHALGDARHAKGIPVSKSTAPSTGQISSGASPDHAGARRLDARQRTRRAGRNLCLHRGLEATRHTRIHQPAPVVDNIPRPSIKRSQGGWGKRAINGRNYVACAPDANAQLDKSLDEVECRLCYLAPAAVDRERVPAVRNLAISVTDALRFWRL